MTSLQMQSYYTPRHGTTLGGELYIIPNVKSKTNNHNSMIKYQGIPAQLHSKCGNEPTIKPHLEEDIVHYTQYKINYFIYF